jgi:putative FmdB family regulatory protein
MALPVYEYRCNGGHEYEKTEGFDAPAVQTCPDCGAEARRLLSVPAVIFKGSGFYSTDNRKSWSGGNGSRAGASEDGHGHESSNGSDAKSGALSAE